MSDTPRTSRDALKSQGELVKKFYDDKIARLERELAAAQSRHAGAIDSLREHIEICNELKKDTERLDWCILNKRFPSVTRPITTAAVAKWTCANSTGFIQFEADTAREAIDAAMKECGK